MNDALNGANAPEEHEKIREELMRVLQHQVAQRWTESGALLETLIEEYGDRPILVHYQGLTAIGQGDDETGQALMERALEASPDDPIMLCDYGAQLASKGKLDEALLHFQSAVDVAPNYAIARGNLGAAQVLNKDYRKAIANLKKAVELDSNLLDAHTNLGVAYMETNHFGPAVDILFKALSINPLGADIHTRLSAALFRRERHDTAEYHARRAIELAPKAGEPYLHLGNALAAAGRTDDAVQALMFAARRPPVGLAALSRLIHVRKTKEDSPEFKLLQDFLQRAEKTGDEPRAALYYAAGKAFDDMGDYKQAFDYFHKANELTAEQFPFDAEQYVARADRMREFCAPALIKRCSGGGVDTVAPIFICGMPRSGTTLTEQMFSRHPKVQPGGEMSAALQALQRNQSIRDALEEKIPDEEITADDFSRLGEDYVAAVRAEGIRAQYFTDKMPANHRNIGLLSLALPRAKFLIMRRHPLGCLFSNYMQHFGQNQPFASKFQNLAIAYKTFDIDATLWADRLPDAAREVPYEGIVQDAEASMRGLLDFVGLEWADEVLDHKASTHQVNTASMAQVREPIYTRAVARWEHYREELAPLIEALGPLAQLDGTAH
ncbi:TPR domain protein [Candidatus Rhodobacter oscarellae]|uniref:TPR domain protein n=1 Tax=Candidatus Rhodobacter oscarellae TaxID=1675527 RepID=A0A0J9GUD2_9RHOB|nr:tetratricopeptide repeat-containing sulfotransferase family protein [Candidatus Rhodobacter lobularis]KMW57188.1 TPR domain protein [Candidatus Rhodobacter lobularis]